VTGSHKTAWDDVFLDLDPERGIVAGQRWKEALQKSAQRCEMVLAPAAGLDRWWKVASRAHPVPDPVEIPRQIGFECLDRLPIHPGRTTIGFDRFVGFVHQPLVDRAHWHTF
jgi:hypothetical protein